MTDRRRPARLGETASVGPDIQDAPLSPVIDLVGVGKMAPTLLDAPPSLPRSDVIVGGSVEDRAKQLVLGLPLIATTTQSCGVPTRMVAFGCLNRGVTEESPHEMTEASPVGNRLWRRPENEHGM
jgi:hypothetical protein